MAREQTSSPRQQRGGQEKQESKQNTMNRTETKNEQEREIETSRDRGTQTRGGLAPIRGGRISYGPSGNSQAIMRHMADDIDQLLQLFGFGSLGLSQSAQSTLRSVWSPQIEVLRKDGNLVVRADLPGVKPEDVNVEIEDGVLTISGERREEHEESREGFYRTERTYGQFYRAIPLPEGTDENNVDAKFDNGELEIRLPEPKQEQRQPKRVEIKSRNA